MQGLIKSKRIEELINEYKKLCLLLSYEEVLLDKKLFLSLKKQKQILQPLFNKYEEYLQTIKSLKEINSFKEELSESEKILLEQEIKNLKAEDNKLEKELYNQLSIIDAVMQKVVVEIDCGKEGLSQTLFKDLIQGYLCFCKENNLNIVLDESPKKAQISIFGLNAKQKFLNEAGLHVAIKNEDKASCQVFVCEFFENDNFVFDEKDIAFSSCKSSGAGGQHVNTTDSAIKATHVKTNLSVVCQDERSQFQNKQKAIVRLKQKVEDFYNNQKEDLIKKQKKEQLKKIKNNYVVKTYDYQSGKIKTNNNQTFLINEFLLGKEI